VHIRLGNRFRPLSEIFDHDALWPISEARNALWLIQSTENAFWLPYKCEKAKAFAMSSCYRIPTQIFSFSLLASNLVRLGGGGGGGEPAEWYLTSGVWRREESDGCI